MSERLPDFLVVGAMKSATTTLYFDLEANPAVRFPVDKEPNDLCSDRVLTAEGKAEYAAKYTGATNQHVCGDASTQYTQMPLYVGVPERASAVLGPKTRIVYIVRDPVERILSHHRHYVTAGLERRPLSQAIREDEQYIAFSRYAYQFEPWARRFDRRLVLLFDELVTDRRSTMRHVCEFLGAPPHDDIDETEVHNAGGDRRPLPPVLQSIMQAGFYREHVRPRLSPRARTRIRRVLRPRRGSEPTPPPRMSREDLDYVLAGLADDIRRSPEVLGRRISWTVESLLRRHGATAKSCDTPSPRGRDR